MINPERKGEGLDKKILLSYLSDCKLIANPNTEIEVWQFSNGFSNLTYLLKVDDKEFVLRKPPLGAIKRGHDMGREYKVLLHLNPHFSKAPKTFAYESTGDVIGAPFYLMEKINGVILTYKEAIKRSITPEEFAVISNSWLDTFVELHQLDYMSVGLGDLGKPEGYVERQVSNWSQQYLKAATQELPDAHFVMKWMQDNQVKDYRHSLIHNDYKYDNVVFKEGDWSQLNAVLDWEMCTLGDPLMDLGTSLAYWTMDSDGPATAMSIPSPTMLSGNLSRSELVQAYALKSGNNIQHLTFYYVFGLFKLSVIVQQIFYRYEKGLTQNPKFAELDKVCAFLCLMAKQAIQKNRIGDLF